MRVCVFGVGLFRTVFGAAFTVPGVLAVLLAVCLKFVVGRRRKSASVYSGHELGIRLLMHILGLTEFHLARAPRKGVDLVELASDVFGELAREREDVFAQLHEHFALNLSRCLRSENGLLALQLRVA